MTKTKRQLRAEAVERLRERRDAGRYIDGLELYSIPLGTTREEASKPVNKNLTAAIIDLLTDDEPPEGDPVRVMRKALDNRASPTFCALIRYLKISNGLSASWHEAEDALRMLADMVERDYVRREDYDKAVAAMNDAAGKWAKSDAEARELRKMLLLDDGAVEDYTERADPLAALAYQKQLVEEWRERCHAAEGKRDRLEAERDSLKRASERDADGRPIGVDANERWRR